MKRRYTKPVVKVIKINSSHMLCTSGDEEDLKFNQGEEVSTGENEYSHDENYNIVW